MKRRTQKELIDVAHKVYKCIAEELKDEDDKCDPVEAVLALGIVHRMIFATVERNGGIEAAREATGGIIDLVECTMERGAWDEENQCMK